MGPPQRSERLRTTPGVPKGVEHRPVADEEVHGYGRVGCVSNFGTAGSVHAHGCAVFVQMSAWTLNQLGSSRLAALIDIPTPRDAALSANRGEPHVPQNPRRAMLPLSESDSCQRGSPVIFTAAVGTMSPVP